MQTTVVNMKYIDNFGSGPNQVFIGRPFGRKTHYGNPFTHLRGLTTASVNVGSREEAIDAFRQWLKGTKYHDVEPARRQWILHNLERLRGKTLGCFCKPLACHGDVYVELLSQEQEVPCRS